MLQVVEFCAVSSSVAAILSPMRFLFPAAATIERRSNTKRKKMSNKKQKHIVPTPLFMKIIAVTPLGSLLWRTAQAVLPLLAMSVSSSVAFAQTPAGHTFSYENRSVALPPGASRQSDLPQSVT
jgi:hypothetical protein